MRQPYVVVSPEGLYWLGYVDTEQEAWTIALGWPDFKEILEHKRKGWYCVPATVTWQKQKG